MSNYVENKGILSRLFSNECSFDKEFNLPFVLKTRRVPSYTRIVIRIYE